MKLSAVLLVAALALTGAVAAWGIAQRGTGETGTYAVSVIGPEGPLFFANVTVENATALRALQAAADERGATLALEEYPGMGTYVRAVDGHAATGGTGWIYEVHRDGDWTSGDRSAAFFALQKGDALRWSWTDG